MNNLTKALITIVLSLSVLWQPIHADTPAQDTLTILRPVYSAYMAEWGQAHIADTYLTPLHYRGLHLGLFYQRSQAMRANPTRYAMQLSLRADFNNAENPAKNATMACASIECGWRMWRKFPIYGNLTAGIGPGTTLNLGIQYLSRNSNNPASAKAAWTIDACAYANYKIKLWRIPVNLRYQAQLPLTGAFFAPNYGQLYYQIYLGDNNGLAHMAWPGNYFALDNLFTADFNLGTTSIRLGYHGTILSTKCNNIVSNMFTHALTVGITTEWISLRPGRHINSSKTISYENL